MAKTNGKQYTLLITGGEEENIETIQRYFNPLKYSCYAEKNSVNAFAAALRILPDLIITDWLMPGVSGLDLLKKLRGNKITAPIPVVFMAGAADHPDCVQTAYNGRAAEIVQKPVVCEELTSRVSAILKVRRDQKKRLDRERDVFLQYKEYLQMDIELKAKELTDLTNQLAFTNGGTESAVSAPENSAEVNTEQLDKNEIDRQITMFKKDLFTLHWTSIENTFLENHGGFKTGLKARNPNLTEKDLKLSLLFRMNLSSKEISHMTLVSYEGIRKARTRLRKKLALESHVDLTEFLKGIG
ncbi:MAG: response regulator [Bacteroidota bacterium]